MAVSDVLDASLVPAVSRQDPIVKSVLFDVDASPIPTTVTVSSDIGQGAVANEIEFAKLHIDKLLDSLSLHTATGSALDALARELTDFLRIDPSETDIVYVLKLQALLTQRSYPKRTTRWSIWAGLSYLLPSGAVSIIEWFKDLTHLTPYFQLRVNLTYLPSLSDTVYTDQSYIDQSFLDGAASGSLSVYVQAIVQRLKAQGVGFDIVPVTGNTKTLALSAVIS